MELETMNLKLNKEKLTKLAIKILIEKLSTKKNKNTGLTEEDIEMFNRVLLSPIEPEVTYQYHHYLDENWQRSHVKTKSKR